MNWLSAASSLSRISDAEIVSTACVNGGLFGCGSCSPVAGGVRAPSLDILCDTRQPLPLDIDLTGFSAAQQRALFHLLILAMYADGHLTTVEDEQLQELLVAFGHGSEFDRQREFDAAVTRVRSLLQSLQKAREQALLLAEAFTIRRQQPQVYEAVQQIMTSDKHVSSWENTLLSALGLKFRS
jgi:hypothetical protein